MDGSSHTSVNINGPIRDQLFIISNEAFVRKLSTCCLHYFPHLLKPRRTIRVTDTSIISTSSDIIRKTSQWAKKLMNRVIGRGESGDTFTTMDDNKHLVNTSSMSRGLAKGGGHVEHAHVTHARTTPFNRDYVNLFCTFIASFLSSRDNMYSDKMCIMMLNTLAFSTSCCIALWEYIEEEGTLSSLSSDDLVAGECRGFLSVLGVWAATYSHLLLVLDDIELYEKHYPLSLSDIERIVVLMKETLYPIYRDDLLAKCSPFGKWLLLVITKLLRDLYDRNSKRLLACDESWIWKGHTSSNIADILLYIPFTIPLMNRLKIFQNEANIERRKWQDDQPSYKVSIRRTNIFQDSVEALGRAGFNWKKKISVTFITPDGREEAGIDIGGVFKELWTSLAAIVFDPSYGLFISTDDNLIFPNPSAKLIVGEV